MTTFASDIFPSAERPKTLTQQEADAIEWHANRELKAALNAGVINEAESDAHWRSVCEDVVGDQELIDKLVAAHKRSLKGKPTNSKDVVIAHDLQQHPATAETERTIFTPREGTFSKRHLITAGATAIGIMTVVRPVLGGFTNNYQPNNAAAITSNNNKQNPGTPGALPDMLEIPTRRWDEPTPEEEEREKEKARKLHRKLKEAAKNERFR